MQDEKNIPIALVAGASRGLGAAVAEALGARGWHVVALARTTGALEELDDRIRTAGGSATLAPMDVTVDTAMQQLCRGIHDRWGGLDLYVHCAIHAPPLSPVPHVDARDMQKSIDTNVAGTARMIQMVAPLLEARENSQAVFFDDPHAGEKFFGAYAATKDAQITLARAWQAETERLSPRVVIHRPAPMATATRGRFFPGEDRSGLADRKVEAERLLEALGL